MKRDVLFEIWSSSQSQWTAWSKATPFSVLPNEVEVVPEEAQDVTNHWIPEPTARCAVVVDLPAINSVQFAVALARQGYQPVLMINALPQPSFMLDVAVDLRPALNALVGFAPAMQKVKVPPNAPPAFILDADRASGTRTVSPGFFDNRSVLFCSDFPSAARMRHEQINQVLVIHPADRPIAADLEAVLGTWVHEGLPITIHAPDGDMLTLQVRRRSWWAQAWVRLQASLLFHTNSTGDFGAIVPKSSGG